MSAAHDVPDRTASAALDRDLWILRAAAMTEPDGTTAVIVAVGGRSIAEMIVDVDAARDILSANLVGVDAARVVEPILDWGRAASEADGQPVLRAAGRPATCRMTRIIFLHDALAGPTRKIHADLEETMLLLVEASANLSGIAQPLSRIADAALRCGIVHFAVTSPMTVSELHAPGREIFSRSTDVSDPRRHTDSREVPLQDDPGIDRDARRYYRGTVLDEWDLEEGRRALLRTRDDSTTYLRVLSRSEAALWERADGVRRNQLESAEGTFDVLRQERLIDTVPSWRIADDIAWVADSDRTTVLGGAYDALPLALAGSAHVIWNHLVDLRAVRQDLLTDTCAAFFEVEPDEISEPVDALLLDLWSRDLVTRV